HRALQLTRLAATRGLPAAQYELAKRSAQGRGVPKDLGVAAWLFQEAANQG
ncbi:MAG: SEL1-like repeat protein, partial [Actinobacteria bacterium]|nr:SEL1-like repeat protein [Actinomycetota bacterium]